MDNEITTLEELSQTLLSAIENNNDRLRRACEAVITTSCYLCKHENYCHKKHDEHKNYEKCWYPISTAKLLQKIAENWDK